MSILSFSLYRDFSEERGLECKDSKLSISAPFVEGLVLSFLSSIILPRNWIDQVIFEGAENDTYKNAPFILERIGLADFFDAVSDGNNITHSKPHPQVFLMVADMLGLKPEECLVVEDAHDGIEAGVAGGFDCAAIGDARDDERAVFHLDKLSDILYKCELL